MTRELSNKIVEIAHARRRLGYRRIHDMRRPHSWGRESREGLPPMRRCQPGGAQAQPGQASGRLPAYSTRSSSNYPRRTQVTFPAETPSVRRVGSKSMVPGNC